MLVCCRSDGDMDEGKKWRAAAAENPVLLAAELFFMARPTERVPWRHLISHRPPADDGRAAEDFSFMMPPPPPDRWGRKRLRSRKAAAAGMTKGDVKEEDDEVAAAEARKRRASPTTPLSWSAGSASSCGGGEGYEVARAAGVEAAEEKRARIAGSAAAGAGSGGGAPGAVPGAGGGSIKAETAGFAGWGGAVPSTKAANRRHGKKKMTAAELKEFEKSLLQERTELRKELEQQKMTHRLLTEENTRLRNLESKWQPPVVTESEMAEGKTEKCHCLPFDLNLTLSEDMDAALY